MRKEDGSRENVLKLIYEISITATVIPANTVLLKIDKRAPGVYIIKEGIVKYFLVKGRNKFTVAYDGANSIHGLNCLFELPNALSLTTLTKVTARFIPLDILDVAIAKEARFDSSIANQFHRRTKILTERLKTMSCMDAAQRVALSILELSKLNGVDHTGSVTKKEIADFAGCSVEYAFRVLAVFQKQGIVELNNRNIIIKNRKTLLNLLD